MQRIFIASKRIKQVLVLDSHRSESADFTCEKNKNGGEYSFLSEYFQKEPNIILGKGFFLII
jgi:hypothetical protein